MWSGFVELFVFHYRRLCWWSSRPRVTYLRVWAFTLKGHGPSIAFASLHEIYSFPSSPPPHRNTDFKPCFAHIISNGKIGRIDTISLTCRLPRRGVWDDVPRCSASSSSLEKSVASASASWIRVQKLVAWF